MENKSLYKLISDIINTEIDTDDIDVRDVIFLAEDTQFTVEQSKVVSPWLLSFALERRYSSDPEDEYPVYSAIRTGASMLYPDEIECLFPLLVDKYAIDTSLVAIKMIYRMFEAQPPSYVGQYEHVANEIYNSIIVPMLDEPMVELSSREGAKAQLCVTALIAMGSGLIAMSPDSICDVLRMVKNKERWFKQYLLHNVKELKTIWSKRKAPISLRMEESLNEIIEFLEEMANE